MSIQSSVVSLIKSMPSIAFSAVAVFIVMAAPIAAQQTTLSGQVRPRFEYRDPTGTTFDGFTSMRVRLALDAQFDDTLRGFLASPGQVTRSPQPQVGASGPNRPCAGDCGPNRPSASTMSLAQLASGNQLPIANVCEVDVWPRLLQPRVTFLVRRRLHGEYLTWPGGRDPLDIGARCRCI